MALKKPTHSELQGEVKRLQRELDFARDAVLLMLPQDMFQILGGYHHCKTRAEVRDWFDKAIDTIVACAERKPAHEMRASSFDSGADRALCPLCGGSATSIYGDVKGFAYPDGLRSHLQGSFNARQCVVTKVASDAALDCADRRGA